MKQVVIIGAGGHGRGILEILRARSRDLGSGPLVRGFLDDDPSRAGSEVGGATVLGTTEKVHELAREGCRFLIGVGDPDPRKDVADRLVVSGAEFGTAIHPSATIYGDVELGPGTVVGAGAVIAAQARLGAHVLVNLGATIGHDCELAAFATVAPGANLGGHVRMEEGAFIAMGGVVIPGLRLGAGSKLGPGSVLLDDLEAGCVAFGVPARVVDRRRKP